MLATSICRRGSSVAPKGHNISSLMIVTIWLHGHRHLSSGSPCICPGSESMHCQSIALILLWEGGGRVRRGKSEKVHAGEDGEGTTKGQRVTIVVCVSRYVMVIILFAGMTLSVGAFLLQVITDQHSLHNRNEQQKAGCPAPFSV